MTDIALTRVLVARFDDGEVLISEWSDGATDVARRDPGGTWGPPVRADVELDDRPERTVSPAGDRREKPVTCTCGTATWNLSARCDGCMDRDEAARADLPGLATP